MSRPVPKPGILDIAPYTPRQEPPFRWPAASFSNCPPMRRRSVRHRRRSRSIALHPRISKIIRKARRGCCARRSVNPSGLDPDRIVCGAGSDEILNLLAHVYLGPGDEAISTTHGFLVYPIATMANGATNVVAAEKDLTTDVDAILNCVTPRTKLVWLANPNNPTGTYIPFDEVRRLRAGLPDHVLLVLDAAYSDYVSRNDYELGIELVSTTDNTVLTHTFSKIHGLAALRIG